MDLTEAIALAKQVADSGGTQADFEAALLEKSCPPSTASRTLESKASALASGWVTTGYYTAAEMRQMILAVMNMTRSVSSASMAQGARYTTSALRAARDYYFKIASRGVDYDETWKKAQVDDAIIDAPSFKGWVLDLLRAGNQLMRQTEIASCQEPFWLGMLSAYVHAVDVVIDTAKAIGSAVVDAGRKVIRAIGWWWPYLKWGSIAAVVLAGGVYGWNKYVSIAESGRKPIDWSKIFPKRKALPSPPVAGYNRRRRRRHGRS